MRLLNGWGWNALSVVLIPCALIMAVLDPKTAPMASLAAVVLLSLLCLGLVTYNGWLRKQNGELKRQVGASGPSQLVVHQAIEVAVKQKDEANHYTLLNYFAHIDGDGNYRAQYERHGVNRSSEPVQKIRVLTCADSNMDLPELGVKAIDLLNNGQTLSVDPIEDHRHQKLFDVRFKLPVHRNEPFAIRCSFVWPRVMRASQDYDFIILKHLDPAIEKLSYTLEFDREPSSAWFTKWTSKREWEPLKGHTQQQQGNNYSYTLELSNPGNEVYGFYYKNN